MLTPMFSKGRNIRTSTITGYMSLRSVAKMRRWRRGTYRYAVQKQRIDDWLAHISNALSDDYDYAVAVAECIEIVRGYGDTYERGLQRFEETLICADGVEDNRANVVRQLRAAAEADEQGLMFAQALSTLGAVH
jgi:indolepyruvate ferredoxin oxidoreductase beta subunit